MAKIKIREGSLEVELEGKPGMLRDDSHGSGGPVWIEFLDYGTRYKFRNGKLVRAEVDGEGSEEEGV